MKNKKVIWFSLIALGCVALSFLISWIFLFPAAIIIIINQKELTKKR